MKNYQVSVVAEEPSTNLTVLRIATAARNSVTQFYPDRRLIFLKQLEELDKKIVRKLELHHIFDVASSVCLQFANDRTVNFSSFSDLSRADLELDTRTDSISLRWSFVFDPLGKDEQHLHSVFVKISESPTPGIFLQRMLSTRTDDLEKPDAEIFSPVVCKLDFADSRFSTEVLALIGEWVEAQPRAETTFGFVRFLAKHGDSITKFVANTLPPLVVLAYVGIWLGYLPGEVSHSTKYAAAWVLVGGALFLVARYVASLINIFFERHIRRISAVPLFQLTAGDRNRMTKYMARSQKSVIVLFAAAVLYGLGKGFGLYLATLIFSSPVVP